MRNHDPTPADATAPPDSEVDIGKRLETQLRSWHGKRQERGHIEAGNAHYNTPNGPPEPDVFRPNRLLQCHRKQYYRERNAPTEQAAPDGIFFVGSKLEEDLVLPYLRSQARSWPDDLYVANSLWIEQTVDIAGESITIRGSTDPVVVTADGTPRYVTEVKSKQSLGESPSVSRHHRAQLHAYMAGLSAKHDQPIHDGAVLYISRESLEMAAVPVSFDPTFWAEVGQWMTTHAKARTREQLPPADPEFDWECEYCPYAARCGKEADSPVTDADSEGFVPGIEYPRDAVEAHLEVYPDIGLTATLAAQYPGIADVQSVVVPFCPECGATPSDSGTTKTAGRSTPLCPECADAGKIIELRVGTSAKE